MRLSWIKVVDLYGRFNHHVELKHEGMTIIHSPNGLGKSTLVRMVCLAFGGGWAELEYIPFARLEFGFEEGRKLVFKRDEGLQATLIDGGELIAMGVDDVMEMLSVIYLGPQRLFLEQDEGCFVSALDIHSENLAVECREAMERAEEEWENDPDNGMPPGDDAERRLSEARGRMDLARQAGLEPRLPPRPGEPDLLSRDPDDWGPATMRALDRLRRAADVLYPTSESLSALMDMFNPMIFRKSLSIDPLSGMVVALEGGGTIPLSMLSSGEKHLLLLLYVMLFEATPGGMVIIDEPETSMHVTWQQRLASLFLSIGRARGLQLVMATHSPQVVHDRWDLTEELVV